MKCSQCACSNHLHSLIGAIVTITITTTITTTTTTITTTAAAASEHNSNYIQQNKLAKQTARKKELSLKKMDVT